MLITPNHHLSCLKSFYKTWVVSNSSFFNPVTYKTHKYSLLQIQSFLCLQLYHFISISQFPI